MQLTITVDQLVDAARNLTRRSSPAGNQLGVEKPGLKQAFVQARKTGRVAKVRDDEENTGHFQLT